MASLPSAHPTLSLHLTDPTLNSLLSSASSSNPRSNASQLRALTDITTASLTVYTSSARLGLGLPQRVLIETSGNGPVVLHSYLNPQTSRPQSTEARDSGNGNGNDTTGDVLDQTREALRPLSGSTEEEEVTAETSTGEDAHEDEGVDGGVTDAGIEVNGQALTDGSDKGKGIEGEGPLEQIDEVEEMQLAPLLIATVVAPSHDNEARRAAGRLQSLGVEFQRKWVGEQEAEREAGESDNEADG